VQIEHFKIVSRGQTGADRAALDFALTHGSSAEDGAQKDARLREDGYQKNSFGEP